MLRQLRTRSLGHPSDSGAFWRWQWNTGRGQAFHQTPAQASGPRHPPVRTPRGCSVVLCLMPLSSLEPWKSCPYNLVSAGLQGQATSLCLPFAWAPRGDPCIARRAGGRTGTSGKASINIRCFNTRAREEVWREKGECYEHPQGHIFRSPALEPTPFRDRVVNCFGASHGRVQSMHGNAKRTANNFSTTSSPHLMRTDMPMQKANTQIARTHEDPADRSPSGHGRPRTKYRGPRSPRRPSGRRTTPGASPPRFPAGSRRPPSTPTGSTADHADGSCTVTKMWSAEWNGACNRNRFATWPPRPKTSKANQHVPKLHVARKAEEFVSKEPVRGKLPM